MEDLINELFRKELRVITLGIETFYRSLKDQEIDTVKIDWRPPAGGNRKLIEILDRLR